MNSMFQQRQTAQIPLRWNLNDLFFLMRDRLTGISGLVNWSIFPRTSELFILLNISNEFYSHTLTFGKCDKCNTLNKSR